METTMRNPSDQISLKRYALLRGWAKYAILFCDDITSEMDRIVNLRGSNFGIAINQDYNALRWQRLQFRRYRTSYAIGMFGLASCTFLSTDDAGNLVRTNWTEDQISSHNRDRLNKYRQRSRQAKRILASANLLQCPDCYGSGCVSYGEDDEPCSTCQIEGVVHLGVNGATSPSASTMKDSNNEPCN